MIRRKNIPFRAGFTLVELVLTIGLLVIVASVAVPRMGWATMGQVQVKTTAREFANHLRLARSLAITHAGSNSVGYSVQLLSGPSYTSYQIKDRGAAIVVKGPIDIPTGITCTGDAGIRFTPLGQLENATLRTVSFTRSGETIVVEVTALGRITVE